MKWTWYCPTDGLEFRALSMTGWSVVHLLTVDDAEWCKMEKAMDCPMPVSCWN